LATHFKNKAAIAGSELALNGPILALAEIKTKIEKPYTKKAPPTFDTFTNVKNRVNTVLPNQSVRGGANVSPVDFSKEQEDRLALSRIHMLKHHNINNQQAMNLIGNISLDIKKEWKAKMCKAGAEIRQKMLKVARACVM
jgi:hypothetical protein